MKLLTLLYYIGGEDIIANTIVQKDNTLFLGDITLKRPLLSNKQLNDKTLIFEEKELYSKIKVIQVIIINLKHLINLIKILLNLVMFIDLEYKHNIKQVNGQMFYL